VTKSPSKKNLILDQQKVPTIVVEKNETFETSQSTEDMNQVNLEIVSSNFDCDEEGPPLTPKVIVDDRINDDIIQEFCKGMGLSLLDVHPDRIPRFRMSLGDINYTLLIDKALYIQMVYGGYCSYYETRKAQLEGQAQEAECIIRASTAMTVPYVKETVISPFAEQRAESKRL
jgi:hypothetical protein